ncbi:hypothetical protein MNV49_001548 [Pseudohyphozyma bogoriensis]|nr:hypothetical protein MNV49_001548 [Pseudohyphozyma bogoriensis]
MATTHHSAEPSVATTGHEHELEANHRAWGTTKGGITFVEKPQVRRRTSSSLGADGSSVKGENSDDAHLVCYNDLFPPPVVRQWIDNGRLYREAEERAPSRYELFFDLILVGVVHQMADVASEDVSGATVAKIVLTFYPAATIWADLRNWMNASGQDDLLERIQLLITTICLVGYSVNAAGIEVGHHADTDVAETVVHAVTRRAAEVAAEVVGAAEDGGEHGEGIQRTVVAAVAFFLVPKLLRMVTYAWYAYALPDFRRAHLGKILGLFLPSMFYFGIIWAPNLKVAAILAIIGIFIDTCHRLFIGVVVTLEKRRNKRHAARQAALEAGTTSEHPADPTIPTFIGEGIAMRSNMMPAVSIEHLIERNAGFTVVVLGESVVSLLYIASSAAGNVGASVQFGRATFALITIFIFNGLYFEATLSRRFIHAIRRHWFTGVLWDLSHFPLCLALILSSAAVQKVTSLETVGNGVRWQYGGGLAVALAVITTKGLLHRSLDPKGASRLSQIYRALARYSVALIFALIPLTNSLDDTKFLATYAGIASALVVFEIWAKLGNEEVVDEVDHRPVEADEMEEEESERREERRAEVRVGTKAGDQGEDLEAKESASASA